MEAETPKRRRGRGLKWAFGLSLALNLFFVGFFAGAVMRFAGDGKGGRPPAVALQNYGAPFVRALPRAEQRKLMRALRANNAGLPTRAERRALHQELIDAMRAEDFDADAVERLFAAQSEAAQSALGQAQGAWLTLVSGMSVAERASVADSLEEILVRHRRKDKRKP